MSDEEHKDKIVEEVAEEPSADEQLMIQKFKAFEKSYNDISYVLQFWDRAQSIVAKPLTPDMGPGIGDDDITGKKITLSRMDFLSIFFSFPDCSNMFESCNLNCHALICLCFFKCNLHSFPAASGSLRDRPPPSGKKTTKKEREKERLERERLERERLEKERIERERMEREKAGVSYFDN